MKLTFLGTSAQIPSASRNHTSILLDYPGENILIDCGEGTQRQFRKAKLNPCKITRILITHWHGDHILGLPGILSTLALSGYNKTLYVYGPKKTKVFMNELLKLFNFSKEYKIVVEEVSGKFFENDDFYLEAKAMKHGIPTNAYNFVEKGQRRIDRAKLKKSGLPSGPLLQKLKDGKNVSFEGKKYLAKDLTYSEEDKKISIVLDTANHAGISSFVKDANLFICESSFHSELADKAKEHLHLTSKQAGEISKKAKVGRLVLTHIGGRYEMVPKKILEDAQKVFKNCVVAKDLESFEL